MKIRSQEEARLTQEALRRSEETAELLAEKSRIAEEEVRLLTQKSAEAEAEIQRMKVSHIKIEEDKIMMEHKVCIDHLYFYPPYMLSYFASLGSNF